MGLATIQIEQTEPERWHIELEIGFPETRREIFDVRGPDAIGDVLIGCYDAFRKIVPEPDKPEPTIAEKRLAALEKAREAAAAKRIAAREAV